MPSTLSLSTLMGGSATNSGFAVAADAAGNTYVTGTTASVDFPTTAGAFDRSLNGVYDAFMAKFGPDGGMNQTTLFTFTVALSIPYEQPVTVSFPTANGTAMTSDGDYIAKSGTLTFAPGETTKTITIKAKGDRKREANETFYLDLSKSSSNSLIIKSRGIRHDIDARCCTKYAMFRFPLQALDSIGQLVLDVTGGDHRSFLLRAWTILDVFEDSPLALA